MAQTLAQIQEQIQKLQDQAGVLKKKEAISVIAKIKVAIEAYSLTPDDLFGAEGVAPVKRAYKKKTVATEAIAVKAGRKKFPATKKAPSPPKFTDGTKFWSGHGQRPKWFKDAVEAGKTPDQLAVQTT